MNRIETHLKKIRDIFQQNYIIPKYQRLYTWDSDKCDRLWNDLIKFWGDIHIPPKGGKKRENYFLGTIVLHKDQHKDQDTQEVFSIVDGQQRLISLSLLIQALYDRAKTNKELLACLRQKHRTTGDLLEKPRIKSEVLNDDNEAFENIILGKSDEKEHDTQINFWKNYQRLKKRIQEWFDLDTTNHDSLGSLICTLLDQVNLLVIECETEEDALIMFETLNDRGTPLNDADIIKINLYDSAKSKGEEEGFILDWNNLKEHNRLFRIYMHLLRSEEDEILQVMALRKYFLEEHPNSLTNHKRVMSTLGKLNHIHQNEWEIPSSIGKWWRILQLFPNEYWRYPLYVFLIKNTDSAWDDQDNTLKIKDNSKTAQQFKELVEWTVRYFFIRGIIHNTIDAVRGTTFKVYHNISHKKDYSQPYLKNLDDDRDFQEFKNRIKGGFSLDNYQKGMVFIGAALHKKQDEQDLCEQLDKKLQIEHILPKRWNNYDGWTDKTHEEDLNRLGNLVPCEPPINRTASNDFFSRKQTRYKKSKVQDLRDLSVKEPQTWYRQDLEERDEEIQKRLISFFCEQVKR